MDSINKNRSKILDPKGLTINKECGKKYNLYNY